MTTGDLFERAEQDAALARLIESGDVDPNMVVESWSPELIARMQSECCATTAGVEAMRAACPGFAAACDRLSRGPGTDPTDP